MFALSQEEHPFSREPEEIGVAFSRVEGGRERKEDGSCDISEWTNRWIKPGPQAVIGALETLESSSPALSISTFSLSIMVPLFLSNYSAWYFPTSGVYLLQANRVTSQIIDDPSIMRFQ